MVMVMVMVMFTAATATAAAASDGQKLRRRGVDVKWGTNSFYHDATTCCWGVQRRGGGMGPGRSTLMRQSDTAVVEQHRVPAVEDHRQEVVRGHVRVASAWNNGIRRLDGFPLGQANLADLDSGHHRTWKTSC
jgi:hypothetical protein